MSMPALLRGEMYDEEWMYVVRRAMLYMDIYASRSQNTLYPKMFPSQLLKIYSNPEARNPEPKLCAMRSRGSTQRRQLRVQGLEVHARAALLGRLNDLLLRRSKQSVCQVREQGGPSSGLSHGDELSHGGCPT